MTSEEWKQIRHFAPTENWGDPGKMRFELLMKLDALREFCGNPIIIHCGYATEGHSQSSQHYLGKAADFHIEGVSLINQYLLAERFNFAGIGLYPDWKNPGLHCDVRSKQKPYNRWARVEGRYVFLNDSTLRGLLLNQLLEGLNAIELRLVETFGYVANRLDVLRSKYPELDVCPNRFGKSNRLDKSKK